MADRNMKADMNVQFTEASSRQSIESGESVKTLFGKIRKWLSDLKPIAFSGSYNDLSNKPTTGVSGVKGNVETTYRTGNVNLTPANIGLGNVNNTSDADKPISTATQTALNNKVSKTGDTMSGPLTHNGAGTVLKSTNLDANGDNPTSNTWSNAPIDYHDKDNARMGYVNVQRRTDGSTVLEIAAQARNTTDTADIYNTIGVFVGRDGARSYAVTDSAAFRKAIGTGNQVTLTGAVTGTGTFDSNGNVASVNTTLNSKLSGQINYNTNNGVKNLLSTEWFATNPISQQGTVESYDVKTGSITGFASASQTGAYIGVNISTNQCNQFLEDGKTYILSWTVDSRTNNGIFGFRRADNNAYSVGGSATINRTGNYSVTYTHNSSIPVYFSFCINTAGTSSDKRIEISNLMLREATIEDDTFEPYAEPNYQLTQKVNRALEQTGYNLLKITADTQTINGVTFIVDKAAGTITADGTASQGIWANVSFGKLSAGNYILSGCPTSSFDKFSLALYENISSSPFIVYNAGNNTMFTLPNAKNYKLQIRITAGTTLSYVVFKPMIVPAELAGVPFQPYAKSNAELTADIPLTIHIDYSNIDAHTCDSTYNECLSALESGRAVIAMIQITSKLMRTCFFGLDTDTKIICGEIPNGSTTYDFDWRAGGDCPSIGISS